MGEFRKRHREMMLALGHSVSEELEGWPAMSKNDFQPMMTKPDNA